MRAVGLCYAGMLCVCVPVCVCACACAYEREREHTLPILKANVLPVWVQRTGLYKHNVSKRTDIQIEEGQDKNTRRKEDRGFFIVYSKSWSTAFRSCEHTVDICINSNWVAPQTQHYIGLQ